MKKIIILGLMIVFMFMVSCTNTTVITTIFTTLENTTDEDTTNSTTNNPTTEAITTTQPTTIESTTAAPEIDTISSVLGVENKTNIVGHYFDPLYGV